MEIQFIHVKDGFDKDLNKAVEQSNGTNDTLAILSVLAKFQKSDNAKIKALFDAASQVTTENSTKEFSGVMLKDLLPRNTNGFYRYEGSLTYPNCTEAAIWTIFKVIFLLSLF